MTDTPITEQLPAPAERDHAEQRAQPADSGVHQIADERADCQLCRGTGKALTVRDYLDEIVSFLPDDAAGMDAVIAEFYKRLLAEAPKLARLFPPDLVTGDALNSRGNRQRDQLLNALVALLTRYDPDHPDSESMQVLDTHLAAFGRSHADFDRGNGERYGATPDEYLLVRNVLYSLVTDAAGDRWEMAHRVALLDAFTHAMARMLNAQVSVGRRTFARPARPAVTR